MFVDFSTMKPLYLQGLRSFKWTEELENKDDDEDTHNRSLSPPKEPPPPPPEDVSSEDSDEDTDTPVDSGDEIFHAVPVVISPSMSLSMKFNSSQEYVYNKPPVSWSNLLDERKSEDNNTVNKPMVRHEAGSRETKPAAQPRKSLEISARKSVESGLSRRSLDLELNKQSTASSSSDKAKESSTVSVSDRKKAFEAGSTGYVPRKSAGFASTQSINSALLSKGKPISSDKETKKSAAASEPGRFTSAGALSLGEFLKSQKASEPVLGSGRPKSASSGPKKEGGDSGIVRSVGVTGLSNTLSSWKKSRSVKSTGKKSYN